MGAWEWPAVVGIVGGVALFFALLAPVLVFQQRRYGALDGRRILGAAAVSVYLVALVAYTLLPLPSGDLQAWCSAHGVARPNLDPFGFVDDVRRETAGLSWAQTLRSFAVLQVVFNVVLFVPWGIFARSFFGRGIVVSTVSGLAASTLIEATQYTGVFGLIPCSYRVGDVDDVIMNTSGALIGAALAPVVLRWMPRARDLEQHRQLVRPVTVWRRWTGMFLDAALVVGGGFVVLVVYRTALLASGRAVPLEPTWTEWWLGSLVPWVAVFLVPVVLGSGASWGQRIVWLAPLWARPGETRRGSAVRRATRAACGGAGWCALTVVADLPVDHVTWAGSLATAWAVVSILAVLATRDHRGASYALTGAEIVDVRA
ncbi:VanZ family protein [Mumia sp. DW29H23]|uniref:VanZ family protein n=1 Tax=Mumia sp. DW29H23 TaxID=3421241 RepID=UPI003D685071